MDNIRANHFYQQRPRHEFRNLFGFVYLKNLFFFEMLVKTHNGKSQIKITKPDGYIFFVLLECADVTGGVRPHGWKSCNQIACATEDEKRELSSFARRRHTRRRR